ncbi:hypothetical protein DL767_002790 [Monosporascus sp. MG133]|nr:hypothetical protein DL767_002790 [Monosporascus sp. MG133]
MTPSTKRSILITGASKGGAGNALALAFAAQGLRVFSTARSLESMTNLQENGIETLTLDVTSPESIASLKDEITKRTGGKLDILFNNAGAMYEAPAIEADPSRVRKMFDTNVFGVFDVVAAFAPLLISTVPNSSSSPTVVNVASILARLPFPFSSAYNATKAAVSAYSDTLRLELSPLGVRVVTLFMGEVSTGLMSTDNINFGPDSLYADVEFKVKDRSQRHAKASMTPAVFAQQVVPEVLGTNHSSYIWKGTNAFIVWLLNAIGPQKVFDSNMKSAVGLDDESLRKKIYERGQRLVRPS